MTEKQIIREAMYARRVNQTVLAGMAGLKRQSNVSGLLSGKSMRVDSFLLLLDAMGFEVIVRDKNPANKQNTWKLERSKDAEGSDNA